MKTRILSIIAGITLTASAVQAAAVNISVFDSNSKSVISGTTEDCEHQITISILNSGNTYQDAENMVENSVIYVNQVQPDENGEFSVPVVMSERATGEYTVAVFQDGNSLAQRKMPYSTQADFESALEIYNAAVDAGNVSNVKNALQQGRVALELYSDFDSGEISETTARLMLSTGKYEATQKTELAENYRKAAAAEQFKNGKISNIESVMYDVDVLRNAPVSTALSAAYMTQSARDVLVSKISSLVTGESLEQFDSAVYDAVILSVVKYPTGAGDVKSVIKDIYPDFSNELLTNKALRTVAFKDFSSMESLKSALKSAVDSASGSTDSTSSGKGSGSSGGSGGSFTAVSDSGITVQPQPPVENNVSNGFTDLDSAEWARTAVEALKLKGVISGREGNKFCPNDNITREEFVKLIVMLFDIPEDKISEHEFDDADKTAWYYPYIKMAYASGIVNGKSENIFGVGEFITRQDAAVMLSNAVKGYELEKAEASEFTDSELISGYAADAVRSMREYGVITGYDDGSFRPKNTITRAEAAKMLYEIDERIESI